MDGPPATPQTASPLRRLIPGGGHALALAVLIGSLALVFATWNAVRMRELRAAEVAFIAHTDAVADLLEQRLIHYELVTRGGASLFASVSRPTPTQWRAYVDGMELVQRFPALLGLGFAAYAPSAALDDLQLQWRDAGFGRLTVFPRGLRDAYGPVLYLEPRSAGNLAALGFDMYAEPVRRSAMQAAADTGTVRLTGPVQLIQDASLKTTGLLLYLPVYKAGQHPDNLSDRRRSLVGWVYTPFRMRRFVTASLGQIRADVRFRIYDVTGDPELLFTNAYGSTDDAPAFKHSRTVVQYGRRWRLDFDSPPVNVAAPRLQVLQDTLALGIFASFLMYAVAWMLARTEARGRTIAMRMTEDYRRSEQRFRMALEHSVVGNALLDSQGRVVEVNPAFALTIGRTRTELQGMVFASLFEKLMPEVDRPNTPAEGGVTRSTRRLQRGDGVLRHVQLTYSPVPGNVGEDVSCLVHIEDVTERLRAEARIHALNRTLEARVALRTRELSQANQELESFAYSVSHDLRAPLRAIDGFSRVLTERYGALLDDTGRDYLARVRRGAARMSDLIDAMLKMSRVTRGELKPETVDLSRIAAEIADELQGQDAARSVEWIIEPGLQVVGDAALLRNLLDNLLGNAWKFTRMREAARVEFGRRSEEEGGEYYVRDNGAGFSQQYVDKLFRPFQRLHSQDEFSGHGIGLATVRRIVERHGGSIRAEGAPDAGATFYFTLPGENAPG